MTGLAAVRARVRRAAGPLLRSVPRDHWESDEAFRRRRRVTGATAVTGASLLGVSLSTPPGSPRFYGLTLGVAATWVIGGLASGPLHLGRMFGPGEQLRRPVLTPVVSGVGAFGAFYAAALVARRIPVLGRAIASVLRYADQGTTPLVLTTTLANGVAEEVFFRGSVYAAAGAARPVLASTVVYGLATTTTRNPALVLASVPMGLLFAQQRRVTGGIQASMLTHVVWSTLMLRYLPPLFTRGLAEERVTPGREASGWGRRPPRPPPPTRQRRRRTRMVTSAAATAPAARSRRPRPAAITTTAAPGRTSRVPRSRPPAGESTPAPATATGRVGEERRAVMPASARASAIPPRSRRPGATPVRAVAASRIRVTKAPTSSATIRTSAPSACTCTPAPFTSSDSSPDRCTGPRGSVIPGWRSRRS